MTGWNGFHPLVQKKKFQIQEVISKNKFKEILLLQSKSNLAFSFGEEGFYTDKVAWDSYDNVSYNRRTRTSESLKVYN